jgi:hypothetical protein
MRLVVLELGVKMESMVRKGSGGGGMGGDSDWVTRRGCSTTKSESKELSKSSETNEIGIYRTPFL